jgi:hypothetical protein
MSSQFTIFLSTLAYAEQELAEALRALLNAAAKVMKSTHTNQTLWAMVGNEIELGFLTKGNLPFYSFHARVCPVLLLFAKLTDRHAATPWLGVVRLPLTPLTLTFTNRKRVRQTWLALKNRGRLLELYTRTN